MKRLIWMALLCVVAPVAAWPQSSMTPPTPSEVGQVPDCHYNNQDRSDPVSLRLRQLLDCYSGGVVAAAEEFPASKYLSSPAPGDPWTVGHTVTHITYINNFACSRIAGVAAPELPKIDNEADKAKLVASLKSSVEFCKQAFAGLRDAKLGESISWDGFNPPAAGAAALGERVTRFVAALWVTNVLIEHYGALAVYTWQSGLQRVPTLSSVDTVPRVGESPSAISPADSLLPKTPLTPSAGGSPSPQ
jgi:hypothetical protein